MSPVDWVAAALVAVGLFFLAVAAVGFVRLPDVFCRLHVTGVVDTLGVPLVLLAAVLHVGFGLVSLKLLLTLVFVSVTSPLVGHLLARAALEAGYRPRTGLSEAEWDEVLQPKPDNREDRR